MIEAIQAKWNVIPMFHTGFANNWRCSCKNGNKQHCKPI